MVWKARLHGGEPVSGITILTTSASGKIVGIAIHHRPLPGLLRFSSELRSLIRKSIQPSDQIADLGVLGALGVLGVTQIPSSPLRRRDVVPHRIGQDV